MGDGLTGMIDLIGRVELNEITIAESGRRYGRLRLQTAHLPEVRPGQFAMLKARGAIEPLLRRAMAYYKFEPARDSTRIEFIYQIIGRGTEALARLLPKDEVECLGPLGRSFDLDAANGCEVALVAGGAGSPALYLLAAELVARQIPTRLFLGGASRGDLCGLADFQSLLGRDRVLTATIDGSVGVRGFVTAPLEDYLATAGNQVLICACGPDPMLHRVAQIAAEHRVGAQLSLEAPMACGFGICVGCAVPVRADCPEGFVYQKVCTDGPVFWSHDLAWNGLTPVGPDQLKAAEKIS
ncbi:MAG: dihydroorotate dehydrogenase electron transfer subunit [Blastocatellia bacterium]